MPTTAVAEGEAAVADEVVGTTDGGRDARDLTILVEGGKGPPWSLRCM
jgi:hypothetical protein